MDNCPLKARITDDMKSAMRAKEKQRLGTIRLILSACKQVEVDTRETLKDDDIITILTRMVKQRRESIKQYEAAGRDDLLAQEQYEVDLIQTYLPEQLDEASIKSLIAEAITASGAESMRDMGKVMGILKPKLQGKADMSSVSGLIKEHLQ